ncbi:MAG: hypothetical protein ACYCPP_02155 [Nitrososphaerales archaeon]
MLEPPTEPDLTNPWNRNVWFYGLRIPFSLVFLGWITFAQVLSPRFDTVLYAYLLLAAFFGLVVGAHYIDIATSVKKFSPYFKIPARVMLAVGIAAVVTGIIIGAYISLKWNLPLFLLFVAIEGAAAIAYPREAPKFAHSYVAFGLAWGTVPFLASYYAQAGTVNFLALAASAFVGVSVVMMHHLAVMTRESSDWKNAVYLLDLYRYSVYLIAVISIIGRIFV